MLHSDFTLVGGQAVGDQLFPWFLGSPAGSAVGLAADQGWPAPLLSEMEGTCEGGLPSHLLPWGGGAGSHQLFMGWDGWAAATCTEVQRCLRIPGLQGPASQSP